MKFDIKHRFTGAVIYTAEIDANENTSLGVRKGLAAVAAVKANVSLSYAVLSGAVLIGADLSNADLSNADLRDVGSLNGASGLNDFVKCIQLDEWPITYTADLMQIGCQKHPLDAWRNFSDAEIRAMDGKKALEWWRKWKDWIFQAIEIAPARPTGYVEKPEVL